MEQWDNVLSSIKAKVTQENFDVWFRPTFQQRIDDEAQAVYVKVPNKHFKYWLSHHYREAVAEAMREAGMANHDVVFVADEAAGGRSSEAANFVPAPAEYAKPSEGAERTNLNPKYTFGGFVVGSSNQFAHAASMAVAEQPARAYNPLFIYGDVGLGKTHLMHAIGHTIKAQAPEAKLSYMSSERFMNELINAIRYDKTIEFRQKYRTIDVLLMDDIQFLAGKERTQEEFFHTFNALYDAQKQIVISSDSPPKEIPSLEERLHSRFEWGLIADIQPPDLETKVAILRKKASLEKVELPEEVAFYIAKNTASNVRELEGSLVRLLAYSSLTHESIALALAQKVLKPLADRNERVITIEMIQEVTAEHFHLKPADLKARSNSRRIAQPRQYAMFLCKELTRSSLPQIGREFGGKHHTTVLHAIRKIERMLKEDPEAERTLNRLRDLL